MSDSQTPNFDLTLPDVGGSDGTWGGKVNGNFLTIDGVLSTTLRGSSAMTALPAGREGKALGFDADGNPVALVLGSDGDPSLRADLIASTGGALVAYIATGAGAYSMSVSDKFAETVSVRDFMTSAQKAALLSGSLAVDHSSAFQAAFDRCSGKALNTLQTGCKLHIPAGRYLLSAAVIDTWRNSSAIIDEGDRRKITIEGDGSANTIIFVADGVNAFEFQGYHAGADGGVKFDLALSGFSLLYNPVVLGLTPSFTSTAVRIKNNARLSMDDVRIAYFTKGLDASDVIYGEVRNCPIEGNTVGFYAVPSSGFSNPNVWDFIRCDFGGSRQFGAQISAGCNISFKTCSFEGIGSDRASHAAIKMSDGPAQGGSSIKVDNCYFENNKVLADVWLPWATAHSGTVCIMSNSFQRTDNDRYQAQHVLMSQSSTGDMNVFLASNAFKSFSPYVVATNPVWTISTDHVKVTEAANYYQNTAEAPSLNSWPVVGNGRSQLVATARVNNGGAATLINGWNVISAVRQSAGVVRLTYKRAPVSSAIDPSFGMLGNTGVAQLTTENAAYFDVTTCNMAGTPTDLNFSVHAYGILN